MSARLRALAPYLLVLAGVFFFWFLTSLRDRLRVVEGGTGRLTAIVFAGGIVFIAMLMVIVVVTTPALGDFFDLLWLKIKILLGL